jgi:putative tricarboxylic transport membrane protein
MGGTFASVDNSWYVSPAAFPLLLGVLFVISGACVFVRGVRGGGLPGIAGAFKRALCKLTEPVGRRGVIVVLLLFAYYGLLLATVGIDSIHAYQRFTFGSPELTGGINPIPVILGAFAVPQIIRAMMRPSVSGKPPKITRLLPQLKVLKGDLVNAIRSGLLGVGVGSIPGVGEDIAAWLSYDTAKKFSKEPEVFGQGSMEGLVAAESANNACIGGALIPLITLGIPGSPPAMMLLGALSLNHVIPGPNLTETMPHFIPQMAAILLWASFVMLVLGFLLSRVSVHILRIPTAFLMPVVALFSVIGSYAITNSLWDVGFMLAFGVIAYFLEEQGYPLAPLVIGLILGPMAESNLRRALMDSGGSLMPFFTRPLALAFVLLIVGSLALQFWIGRKKRQQVTASRAL